MTTLTNMKETIFTSLDNKYKCQLYKSIDDIADRTNKMPIKDAYNEIIGYSINVAKNNSSKINNKEELIDNINFTILKIINSDAVIETFTATAQKLINSGVEAQITQIKNDINMIIRQKVVEMMVDKLLEDNCKISPRYSVNLSSKDKMIILTEDNKEYSDDKTKIMENSTIFDDNGIESYTNSLFIVSKDVKNKNMDQSIDLYFHDEVIDINCKNIEKQMFLEILYKISEVDDYVDINISAEKIDNKITNRAKMKP